MGARSFEDLIAWQKSRLLASAIGSLTRQPNFVNERVLVDQILRAVRSIGANIAEGFERNSRREFAHFLSIAKGSAAEVRAHLYTAYDSGLLPESQLNELQLQANEVGRILHGLRAAVLQQRKRE